MVRCFFYHSVMLNIALISNSRFIINVFVYISHPISEKSENFTGFGVLPYVFIYFSKWTVTSYSNLAYESICSSEFELLLLRKKNRKYIIETNVISIYKQRIYNLLQFYCMFHWLKCQALSNGVQEFWIVTSTEWLLMGAQFISTVYRWWF